MSARAQSKPETEDRHNQALTIQELLIVKKTDSRRALRQRGDKLGATDLQRKTKEK